MDAFAQVAGTPLGGSTPPIDMSVYGLFLQADWVVKAVMIALLLFITVVQYYQTYLSNWLGLSVVKDLRVKLYGHILIERRLLEGAARGQPPGLPLELQAIRRLALLDDLTAAD